MSALDHAIPRSPQRLRDGRTLLLRRARPSDAAGLLALSRAIVAAGEGVVLSPEDLPAEPRPLDLHRDDLHLLAFVDGEVAGEANVERLRLPSLRHNASFTLGVTPALQGLGLGRLLAERALAWADDNGVLRVDLQVLAANRRALALYASLGFVERRRKPGFVRWPDGRVEDDLTMERLVPAPPTQRPLPPGEARRALLETAPELEPLPPPLRSMQLDLQERSWTAAWPEARDRGLYLGEALVGRALVAEEDGALRIIDLLLAPGARGAGLGAATLRALQREAAARGLGLRLRVLPHNPARRLYARLGFVEQPEEGLHVAMAWSPRPAPRR